MTCAGEAVGVTSQPSSAGSQETGSVARSRASSGCGSRVSSSTVALAPIGYLTQATLRPFRGGQCARASGEEEHLPDAVPPAEQADRVPEVLQAELVGDE